MVRQVAAEAELVAATRQLNLLKEGYSKARDNLRAEQSVRAAAASAQLISHHPRIMRP